MFHPKGPTLRELVVQGLSSTKEGYDLLAPKFDFTPFRTPDMVLEAAVEYLKPRAPFHNALDLFTGTGAAIKVFAPLIKGRFEGIDWSGPMLCEAQKNLMSLPAGSPRVYLIEQDVFALKSKAQFDLVLCFGAAGHIVPERQQEFVSSVYRALRPGGLFVLLTSIHPPWYSPLRWFAASFDAAMRVRNALVKPEFVMYYLAFLAERAEKIFREEGFRVDSVPLMFGDRPTPLRFVIGEKP